MAIIGPKDLPKVLRVESNPLKLRTLHALGHPNVRIELTEDQFEELLRVTGDFIATYFPQTERYSYFYTQALVSSYPLPDDAYWLREVAWDPVVTRINDVFSAEMFLFCFAPGFQILNEDGILIPTEEWTDMAKNYSEMAKNYCKNELAENSIDTAKNYDRTAKNSYRAKTPYGPAPLKLIVHPEPQKLVKVVHREGSLICTPNQPIKVNGFSLDDLVSDWIPASDLKIGTKLVVSDGESELISVENVESDHTTTVVCESCQCFYGCHEGKPVLVH